jgi:hypothetical protein
MQILTFLCLLLVPSSEEKSKLGLPHLCFSCATIRGMDKAETKKAADKNNTMVETTMVNKDILPMPIISGSSHRDGSIYKRRHDLERDYCVDIADRTESMLSGSSFYFYSFYLFLGHLAVIIILIYFSLLPDLYTTPLPNSGFLQIRGHYIPEKS